MSGTVDTIAYAIQLPGVCSSVVKPAGDRSLVCNAKVQPWRGARKPIRDQVSLVEAMCLSLAPTQ